MPRRSKGPRLWPDKKRDTWTIIDGRSRHRTGCSLSEIGRAEKELRAYIEKKHKPATSEAPVIADVLSAYAEEHVAHVVSGKHILYDIRMLNRWWGAKKVTDINAPACRAYISHRKGASSARRELAFLRAAIGHWRTNHAPTMAVPKIKLPPKPEPRQDFMTRSEAAKFLWAARHTPHLCRFFLIGWYTGSRRTVITGLQWSMVNFETRVMQRKPRNAVQTRKKAPPLKLGNRILSHLRRWHRLDGGGKGPIIRFAGKQIFRPQRAWDRARKAADLPSYVVPHILRHSRATHMLRAGVPPWEVANALGMSLPVLFSTYGHHIPDWQEQAANAR